jgi:RNA polymerase sigma-70 factor (ECF subfamily)
MPNPALNSVNAKGLSGIMSSAITQLYEDAEAGQYGMDVAAFTDVVGAILQKAAADRSDAEQITLLRTLHLKELVLARACATGNDAAWDEFMKRFRPALYATAVRLTQNDAAGQELAASLWADLYGLPNREGRRVSRLESYTGRGSLEGWLRTVLAQRHIDYCRSVKREMSFEEKVEEGVYFAAPEVAALLLPDQKIANAVKQTLASLDAEERFLLAAYFLDRRTLAAIGRQMGAHESTISRKIDRLTKQLHKKLRLQLESNGFPRRACEEIMAEIDVRDININVAATLQQEQQTQSF